MVKRVNINNRIKGRERKKRRDNNNGIQNRISFDEIDRTKQRNGRDNNKKTNEETKENKRDG